MTSYLQINRNVPIETPKLTYGNLVREYLVTYNFYIEGVSGVFIPDKDNVRLHAP